MLAALLTLLLRAQASPAVGLRLEDATFRQFEDGPPYQQAYRSGEVLFLDLRIAGYAPSVDESPELKLKWTIQALDSRGRSFEPPVSGKLQIGLAAQDSGYRPRARFSVTIPVFALAGTYRIEVKVIDEVSQQVAEGIYPFRVQGKQLQNTASIAASQVRFFRQESEPVALTRPLYRPGAEVWLRFDIEGFLQPTGNDFSVNYGVVVTGPDGKQFLKQDPAAAEAAKPYYPQAYVPATFVIQLPPKALPGDYRIHLVVRDLALNKQQLTTVSFRVE